MKKIKGVFDYIKKEKKKKNSEKEEKRKKKIIRQSRCDHIAKNTNRSYFKKVYDENGGRVGRGCLICSDLIIDDAVLLPVKKLKEFPDEINEMLNFETDK